MTASLILHDLALDASKLIQLLEEKIGRKGEKGKWGKMDKGERGEGGELGNRIKCQNSRKKQ